ncbi:MAG: hypothetical protein AAB035_05760 [Nitrospirota bacterium]
MSKQSKWESADYPWPVRLKAVFLAWMPSIKKQFSKSPRFRSGRSNGDCHIAADQIVFESI